MACLFVAQSFGWRVSNLCRMSSVFLPNLFPQQASAPLQDGATIACNQSTCNVTFHPLCARNAGCYLAIRQSAGKAVYRCYCLNHSESQRRKDLFGAEVHAAHAPHAHLS